MSCSTARKGRGVTNQLQVLIDSDAFVGQFYTRDAHHSRTNQLFDQLIQHSTPIATTNLVTLGTATVLSHRGGQELAKRFMAMIEESNLPILYVDEKLQRKAVDIFVSQEKKGTSGVDCANVAVMHHYHIPYIFSYDHFYRGQPKIELLKEVAEQGVK